MENSLIQHTHFRFCPHCGSRKVEVFEKKAIRCTACEYVYFHNSASAATGLIETTGGIVLTRRRVPPKRGYYDLPGGFADWGESLETALKREIKEELNIDIADFQYFASFPNTYLYKKVTYLTTDAFFICQPVNTDFIRWNQEISEIAIMRPHEIDLKRIAFESTRLALQKYREKIPK
jgi:ADP-ribose pyrophosphatase YjhB (NUDIX family)